MGAVLAAVALLGCDVLPQKPPAPASVFIQWPARGELARDQAFINSAVAAWDRGFQPQGHQGLTGFAHFPPGTGPHNGSVRVLYAGQLQTGSIAVMEGYDTHKVARLVIISAFAPTKGSTLELTNDVVAPDPAQTHALIIPRFMLSDGPDRTRFFDYESILVLGEPASKTAKYSVTIPSGSSIEPPEQPLPLTSGAAVLELSAPQPRSLVPSGATIPWTQVSFVLTSSQKHSYTIDLVHQQGELAWSTCLVCA